MSVRVALAVLFTLLLLAAVAPTVDDARHARRMAAADRAVAELQAVAADLTDGGPPPPTGTPGARRSLTVVLPADTELVFADGSRVVTTRIEDRRVRTAALPAPVTLDAGRLELRGRTTVTLWYVRGDSGAVLLVARGFIRESAAKESHAVTGRPPGAPWLDARRVAV